MLPTLLELENSDPSPPGTWRPATVLLLLPGGRDSVTVLPGSLQSCLQEFGNSPLSPRTGLEQCSLNLLEAGNSAPSPSWSWRSVIVLPPLLDGEVGNGTPSPSWRSGTVLLHSSWRSGAVASAHCSLPLGPLGGRQQSLPSPESHATFL